MRGYDVMQCLPASMQVKQAIYGAFESIDRDRQPAYEPDGREDAVDGDGDV